MSGYKQALNDLNAGGDSVTKKGKKENLQERMRKKFRKRATSIASSNSENVSPVGEASGVTHPDAYDEHTDRGTESSRPVRHSSRTNIPSPSMESTKSGHSTNSEIDLNAPDANGNYLFSDGKHSSPKTIRANHAKEVAKIGNTSKLKEEQNDVVRPKIRDIHQRRKQKTKTPKVRQVENDHEDTALNQILDEINSGEKAKKQRRSKKLLSRIANRAEGIVDETDSDSKRRGGKTPYEVMELSSSESDDGEYKAREEETIEKKGSLFKHHHPNAQPPKEDESDSEEEYDLKLMYRLLGRRRVGDPPLQKPPVTFVGGMGLGGTPMLDRHERRRQRQLEREELERDPLKKFLAGRLCYSDEEEDDDPFRELLDLIGNPNDQENQEGGNAANGGLGGMGIPQPSNEDPMAQFERFTRQGENIGNIPDSPLLRQLMEPPKQLPENTPQRELMKMLLGEDDGSDPPQSDLMKQLKSQPGGFNPIPPPSQQPSPSDLMRQMMGGGDPGEGLPPPSQSDMVRQMMRGGRGRGEGDLPRPPSDLMRQMMGRGRQQGEGDFPAPPNDIMRQLLGRGGGGQGDGDFPSPPDDLMRQLMGGGRPQQGEGDFPSPPDDLMQQLMGGGRPQQAQGGMPAPPSDLMQQMMGGGRQQGEGDLPRPPSDLMRQLIGGGRPQGEENDLLRRLSGIGRHEEFDVPRRRPPQRQRPPPNQDRPGLIAPLHPKNPSANPPKPAGSNQPPPVAGSNQPEEDASH